MRRKEWRFITRFAIGLMVCGVALTFVFDLWKRGTEEIVGTQKVAGLPRLQFRTESIEALLAWFDDGSPIEAIPDLTPLFANRLMEQVVFLREMGEKVPFADALGVFASDTTHADYLLAEAYSRRERLAELVAELSDPAVTRHIWEYVTGFFPDDFPADELPPYEVFFTATGWHLGDAMVFSYNPETCKITDDEDTDDAAKSVVMFNLTLVSSLYGDSAEQQIRSFQNVMAHELFHALLSDYRAWRQIPTPRTIEEQALFTLYNEGIAHYLADGAFIRSRGDELNDRELAARRRFEEQWRVICNPDQPDELREAALREGTQAASYWDKYIAVTGLFMAAHIDRRGGRELLRECIARGPEYFVETWERSEKQLP